MLINREEVMLKFSKGSHKEIQVKCDNCDKIFERIAKEALRCENHFCCKECQAKYKAKKEYKRFSELIGCDAKEYLFQKYVIEKKSAREISKEIYGKETMATSINKWIKRVGLKEEIRHGSDAIKTQWLNNDERRKQASEIAKNVLHTKEVVNKAMETKMSEAGRDRASKAKMGENNPMYGVRGQQHPNWNEERTQEEREKERKTYEYSQWRKQVLNRDNFKCQHCGATNEIMIAHHLNSYTKFIDERYDISNGLTLCEECHDKFHSIFGCGDNTKEQYKQFELIEL